MENQQQLFIAAKEVLVNSYAPYSNYQVGASILSNSGKIYSGTNIENVAYGLTLCAEACAISQMISSGETQIKALLVMAKHDNMCTPCGACRQRIAEFASPQTKIYMCNSKEVREITTLEILLPYAFQNKNIKRS